MLGPHCDGARLTTALASAVASRAQRHKHSLSNFTLREKLRSQQVLRERLPVGWEACQRPSCDVSVIFMMCVMSAEAEKCPSEVSV